MMKEGEQWVCKAAGPTTSSREEPYQWEVIRDYKIRGVIGKGGMGPKTLAACREYGAVYLHAIGGAAQVCAATVKRVDGVDWLDLGSPEATFEAWLRSPGHRANLLKPAWRDFGVALERGTFFGNANVSLWVLQFGRRS